MYRQGLRGLAHRGQAGHAQLRRDVLQTEAQTGEERFAVTRPVRAAEQGLNRGCLENSGLFRPRFINHDHEYQKVCDLTALISQWQVDLVQFAKFALWSDILDWAPDRPASLNRFPELLHQWSVGFHMWLRAQKLTGIIFKEHRPDIPTDHAILKISPTIDHTQQHHIGQKPG